jgi:NADPH-dependent 2,4-dienoyl-CoA reductase/sulfur reductase-like enzyme
MMAESTAAHTGERSASLAATSSGQAGLVVIGAGLSGLRAVEAAREGGYAGPVTLVGAEEHLPYNRPPLSKTFLDPSGVVDYFLTEDELRTRLGIDVRLGRTAHALDTVERVLTTSQGDIAYEKLIIATGASPRELSHLPPMAGVTSLRTIGDAEVVRAALGPGADIVIIGAGFIGSEIASAARARGATVTIVEAAPVPLVRAVGEVVGAAVSTLHERNGTRLLCGAQIDQFIGDRRVEAVQLTDGTRIPADLVVVGIGAAPATGWLAGSGIALDPRDGGIVCDSHLRTSAPGVYAAGDVAHWPNGGGGTGTGAESTVRLENWTNAAEQGAHAAVNAVFPERATPYAVVPYFWSDWYGNRIQFVGSAAAAEVHFASGNPESDAFIALYRRGETLVGAATLNEPRRVMKLRRMIASQGTIADADAIIGAAAPV